MTKKSFRQISKKK